MKMRGIVVVLSVSAPRFEALTLGNKTDEIAYHGEGTAASPGITEILAASTSRKKLSMLLLPGMAKLAMEGNLRAVLGEEANYKHIARTAAEEAEKQAADKPQEASQHPANPPRLEELTGVLLFDEEAGLNDPSNRDKHCHNPG